MHPGIARTNTPCLAGFKKNVNRATTQVMMKTGSDPFSKYLHHELY